MSWEAERFVMSFLRHDKTYRSDVGGGVRRSCVSSSSAAGSFVEVAEGCLENANGERSANRTPRLSFTMSLGSAIPWRVALRQGPTPLQRPASMLHQSDETVKRPPMRGGNFRPPTWGIFNRRRQVVGRHRPWATGGLPRGFPRLWPAGRFITGFGRALALARHHWVALRPIFALSSS
jgi:hypothetical protein